MEIVNDFTYYIKNVLSAFLIGFALSSFYEMLKFYYKETPTINIYRKISRIMLRKRQILSREEIIKIGKEAIRCKNTKEILTDPIILEDGNSYDKSSINTENHKYGNRALKEFIERLKNKNRKL